MEQLDETLGYGFKFFQEGNIDEARKVAQKTLKHAPQNALAYMLAGDCDLAKGHLTESIQNYLKSLQLNPHLKEAMTALAMAYQQKGEIKEAVGVFYKLWNLDRTNTDVLLSIGKSLMKISAWKEAEGVMKMALKINPNCADAFVLLATASEQDLNFEEAISYSKRALENAPRHISAHLQLGSCLLRTGEPFEASISFRKVLDLSDKPMPLVYSNWLYCLQFLDDPPHEILEKHQGWQQYCLKICEKFDKSPFSNIADPDKKIRVGFTSADFRKHSVFYFINGLFKSFDRERFEFICFSNLNPAEEDDFTKLLKSQVDQWHVIDGMKPLAIRDLITDKGIDILIDLSGHTSRNSLLVYLHRSAPIQVTWLGYPDTTGLDTMDYRLADSITDPEPQADEFSSEQIYRLPTPFLCYHPDDTYLELEPEPKTNSNKIVFGSFNNAPKLSPAVIRIWSEILRQIPNAELVIKCTSFGREKQRAQMVEKFLRHGITKERIKLLCFIPSRIDHLKAYNLIDVALDTFPYNGTSTSCEALWMGVPLITKVGNRHPSRVGMSILKALGLDDWIADSDEEYIAKAVEIANNPKQLMQIKHTLRPRMKNSPLCDHFGFARKFETAIRKMWYNWCSQKTA